MKVGFIGAGKVGTAFALYLQSKGHNIVGFLSKPYSSAVESSQKTSSKAYGSYEELILDSDFVLITTPDSQIGVVVDELSHVKGFSCAFGHMSGALTTDVLLPLGDHQPLVTLHPLQAFARIEKGRQDLETCTFAIQGNEAGIKVVEELLKTCSNQVITLKKDQKALYHGAACVTSNYLMVITALAEEMIASFDSEKQLGLSAFKNLMVGAIENAIELGSASALTGPIARGDIETVKRHLEAMDNLEMKKAYSTLGMMTVGLASREKQTDPVLNEGFRTMLNQVLEEEECKNER